MTEMLVINTFPLLPLEDPTEKDAELPDTDFAVPLVHALLPYFIVPLSFVVKVIVTELIVPDVVDIVNVALSFAYKRHVLSLE